MNNKRIDQLRDRYLTAKEKKKEPYFDADEIDDLLDSFELAQEHLLYADLLALGLRLHPGSTILLMRQCKELIEEDKADEAMSIIQQIGEKDNFNLDMLKVDCYLSQFKFAEIMQLVNALIKRKADYLEDIFECTAPLLSEMGMMKETIEFTEKGLKLFPKNIILMEELYYALEHTEEYDRAIAICNELIDLKPYSFDEWFALGRFYAYKADYEHAIEAFEFALACDDSVVELKLLLAYCLNKNGNDKKAMEISTEILENEKDKEQAALLVADSFTKMGDYDAVIEWLTKFMDKYPEEMTSVLYMMLANSLMRKLRVNEAYETLTTAYLLDPGNLEIALLLFFFSVDDDEIIIRSEKINEFFDRVISNNLTPEEMEKFFLDEEMPTSEPGLTTKELVEEFIKNKKNSN